MIQLGKVLVVVLAVHIVAGEGQLFSLLTSLFNNRINNTSPSQTGVPVSTIRPPYQSRPTKTPRTTTTISPPLGNDSETLVGAQATTLNGFVDCVRRCDGRPRTCYFRLHVERYSVLGGACRRCAFGNPSDCLRPQCVTANGAFRALVAVNRQLPAPPIQVCRGDRIVADVVNAMPDEATTIHWHGLRMNGHQYYDGVPYVTQCPIQPGNTFRYIFTADEAGTFFYHSHVGIQKMDGLAGALIVRDTSDSQSNLYTEDRPDHVIFIGDWTNMPGEEYLPGYNNDNIVQVPDSMLINGRGMHWNGSFNLPLSEFRVTRGQRYRFRIIGGTCMTCAVAVRFQGHRVIAISADGNLKYNPRTVDSVIVNSADRFDVILEANQNVGTYYIYAQTFQDFCNGIYQAAILRYEGSNSVANPRPPPLSSNLGVQLNSINSTCSATNGNELCISNLQGVTNAPAIGNAFYAYLFIGFDFYIYNDDDLFRPGTYQHYDEPVRGRRVKSLINNVSFAFPPSPMISQFNDIPQSSFCSSECYSQNIQKACSCTNFYNLPYNTIVNMIIYDFGDIDGFAHPFHLHGYNFYVISMGRLPSTDPNQRQQFLNRQMDQLNNDNIDLRTRPQRDTVSVPPRGYVLIRFVTDNPGYWFLHCHFVFHLEAGMNAVLRVGEQSNLPPVPPNFPRCGNYLSSF
ncbi:unnamed protein product [Nezara viridula]|uniref:Uncharacterized protein n=1 Tax=Nezara viridula TaxID=85310 RepID=A0A9P0MPL1_NEZVI|nr:unnamed protein product [Nezara viridula]